MTKKFYKGFKDTGLDENLRALYEDKGKIPDLRSLDHRRKNNGAKIFILFGSFILLLVAASWLGFILFGQRSGGGGEISLSIEGSEMVTSGSEYDLVIRYKNLDRQPLALTSLKLRPPKNLDIRLATPPPDKEGLLEWNFGTLNPKQAGQIRVKAIPYGFIDDEIILNALFTFKPSNFNAEFQTSQSHTFKIEETPITISITAPAIATPGQEISLKAEIENTSDQIFENIQVSPIFPASFSLSPDQEKIITISNLEPRNIEEAIFKGTFINATEGEELITIQVTRSNNNEQLPIGQQIHSIDVQNSDIGIEFLINENPSQPWVRIGQKITTNLKLTNRRDNSFDNVRATLNINSGLINWESAQINDGIITKGIIAFPKDGSFSLSPKETKELRLSFDLKNNGALSASPFIEIQGTIEYGDTIINIPLSKIIVVSDLRLSSSANYYDAGGTVIGSGPLPPSVGEETTYRIKFRLNNTLHDLSNIVVSAKLPENGKFIKEINTQSGRIEFNETTREIKWEVARMPVTTPELSSSFDIAITPSESDRGQLALLLGISRVESLDTIAQVKFSADSASLSSNLNTDSFANGKGIVQ